MDLIDREKIVKKILYVYKKCDIRTFPIDCFVLLEKYGFTVHTYSNLFKNNPRIYELCIACSDDAYILKNIIAYNDRQISSRIRFSLMHEFAHHILKHKEETPENEEEADYFASYILAPRSIMYDIGCRNADDIHSTFEISYTASNRAWYDYCHGYKPPSGAKIKDWFFPIEIKADKPENIEPVIAKPESPVIDAEYIPSKEFEEHRAKVLEKIKRQRRKIQKQLQEFEKDMAYLESTGAIDTFSRGEKFKLYGTDL